MKTMNLMLGLAAGAGLSAAPGADLTLTEDAARLEAREARVQVTLPYADLKSLWDAAQARKLEGAEPPVGAVLLAGEYELALAEGRAELLARYHVRALAPGWHAIPLLGGQARLEQAEIGTEQGGVVWRDESYCLLTEGKGDVNVTLRLAVDSPAVWTKEKGLHLRPGVAPLNRLRISGLPERMAVRLEGLAPTEEHQGEAVFHLPASLPDLTLHLEERGEPVSLPRVQTAQATVTRAEYQTRLVTDGALLVSADLVLAHQAPLNWRVQLPVVDELLSCQVNGQALQPVRRGPQEIEFPLAAPEGSTTRVTFAYTARQAALDPVSGSLALDLPRTDLFVYELDWRLTIPDLYEATALQGNVQIATGAALTTNPAPEPGSVIWLRKELLRGEAPAVELHYQRRGLEEAR